MSGIPEGDPGALRSAARAFRASGAQMREHTSAVGVQAVGFVMSWRGIASLAHGAAAAGTARDLSVADTALSAAAGATEVLADALEQAQEEARQVLAQIAQAEASAASLAEAQASAPGPQARLLSYEMNEARSQIGSLHGALAAINERAEAARVAASREFERISAMAPLVRDAFGGEAALSSDAYAHDPRLALLIDTIARAGDASSPEELRAILGELSGSELAMVLEAAPGLALMLTETGLPRHTVPGSPEAALRQAMEVREADARIAAIAAVFEDLGPEQGMILGLLYPTVVGNLDGAPIPVRVAANRVHITGERQRVAQRVEDLETRLAALEQSLRAQTTQTPGVPNPAPLDRNALIEMHLIRQELEGLRPRLDLLTGFLDEQVRNPNFRLVPEAPRSIDRQFLVFDPRRDGLVAEIHGVIGERTRDVAIFVPGTGADMMGFESLSDRGAGFARAQSDGSLAAITWLGYDAPDSVPRDAPFNNYADAGGPALRDFVTGLGLDSDIDVTAAGHSYGGAVVGAAEREGMRVDNVIHVASAGASVDDISDYPHDARRYSLTAPGDLIGHVQGTLDAEPNDPGDNRGHGIDPDELPGVVRMETGRTDADDPHSDLLKGPGAHSDVFTPGSDAWNNIFNVMVGGEVTLYQPPDVDYYVAPPFVWRDTDHPMEDPDYMPPKLDVP